MLQKCSYAGSVVYVKKQWKIHVFPLELEENLNKKIEEKFYKEEYIQNKSSISDLNNNKIVKDILPQGFHLIPGRKENKNIKHI